MADVPCIASCLACHALLDVICVPWVTPPGCQGYGHPWHGKGILLSVGDPLPRDRTIIARAVGEKAVMEQGFRMRLNGKHGCDHPRVPWPPNPRDKLRGMRQLFDAGADA